MLKGRSCVVWLLMSVVSTGAAGRNDPGTTLPPTANRAGAPVRSTVEVRWEAGDNAGPVVVRPSAGARIVEGTAWPEDDGSAPAPLDANEPAGAWRLGASSRAGRARLRLEAPIDAVLELSAGEASLGRVRLLDLLEGPRSTVEGPLSVDVRRLAWDAIEVHTTGDGVAEPGAIVPLTIGFNVLTPEPTEVELGLSAVLRPIRGGEALWQIERTIVVPTNAVPAPARILPVAMPTLEGSYELEIQTTWRPSRSQQDGSRLSGWWRLLKGRSADSATRRVSLSVLGPSSTGPRDPVTADVVVDSVDLGRPRVLRPLTTGRSPVSKDAAGVWPLPEALGVEPHRRERLWSLIGRVGSDYRPLAPAGPEGLAWLAVPLAVARPDRPHRLELNVLGGDPRELAVALLAPGERPRLLLDTRGEGQVVEQGAAALGLSWNVWPDCDGPVLVVANRSAGRPLWLGDARLVERGSGSAAGPTGETPGYARRRLGVAVSDRRDLERFGGGADGHPADALAAAWHLAAHLADCGATLAVLPPEAEDRTRRSGLEGQADEDSIGPDRLDLSIRLLRARGAAVLLEARFEGELEGLPALDDPRAADEGLVPLDREGRRAGLSYNLLHADVRAAMIRRGRGLVDRGPGRPRPDGLLVRLGPGPTLPGHPGTGLDDRTYSQFVGEAIGGGTAPGLDAHDAERHAGRADFVAGPGLVPWSTWRSRQVGAFYAEFARSLREVEPGVTLAVATPGLDAGPAGEEALRCDRDGLPPDQGWRSVGLDLAHWPVGSDGLMVLRGVAPDPGELAHDLGVHPDLDDQVRPHTRRGTLIAEPATPDEGPPALKARPSPAGPAADEPLGHALAALDAQWIVVDARATIGQEGRLRRFADVFAVLPYAERAPASSMADLSGTVARAISTPNATFVTLGNDTPYTVRIQTFLSVPGPIPVDDLGRGRRLLHEPGPDGSKRIVVELPPFGATALRVGLAGVRIRTALPYFDPERERHRDEAAARLRRLAEGGLAPLDPSFEPEVAEPAPDGAVAVEGVVGVASGWTVEGDRGAEAAIDRDRPHAGRGSLRLRSSEAAALVSAAFEAPADAVIVQAWVRTEPPDVPVRVRIESEPDPGTGVEAVRLTARLPGRARTDWTLEALRAAGLPTAGTGRIRLRFELMGAGTLWIDDLAINAVGHAQARGCLTAALQAYDEGRMADFARLANTHWARRVTPLPTGETATARGGDVTDLPSRPRLR